jgi:hypothetical protein
MPTPLNVVDWLRIERAVWTVDTYIQGLPSRSRVAVRRELRNNLRSSAAEVGAPEALRALGSLRRLALGYLDAEYGEGRPRPEILKGVFWTTAYDFAVVAAMIYGYESFLAGLETGGAEPGTYVWEPGRFFGYTAEVTFDENGLSGFSWSLSALFIVYSLVVFLVGARMWRLVPAWWRRVRRDRAIRSAAGNR